MSTKLKLKDMEMENVQQLIEVEKRRNNNLK